ncbi:MAG TPA: cupin domain-containing protein [Candidatus Limnocylindria bacterium]|nr:cupin domain-containing protein [Candidatus Limnocylindria bacterium]
MYISAEKIAAMEGMRKVHTLNAGAVRTDKSLGDEAGLKNLGIHLISIAPGDKSTEFHAHTYEDEAIYVLSGHGTEVIGDEIYKIGPGDFIGLPAGGPAHETVNDGSEPLVCLVIGQRLAQDVVDYPRKGKRLYRNSGQRDMVDISKIDKR